MSDIQEIQEKLERLQVKTKRSQMTTYVIYAIIVVIFVVYSAIVPRITGEVLNPETGSDLVLTLVSEQIPKNDEILNEAKTELPKLLTSILDDTENKIPIFEEAINDITSSSLATIYGEFQLEIKPTLKATVSSHLPAIKKFVEGTQDKAAVDELYKAINKDLNKELLNQTKKLGNGIDVYAEKLRALAVKTPTTQHEKAQQDFLIAYSKLSSSPHFEEILTNLVKETFSQLSF